MPDFPRTIQPKQPDLPSVPGSLLQVTGTGASKSRSMGQQGRRWRETYPPLNMDSDDVWAWIADVLTFWHQGTVFDITHPGLRGSGISPGGTGTAGVTVDGGSQTGNTIDTTGWPASTSDVVKAGDIIKIGGLRPVYMIRANANSDGSGNATLSINPPIFAGNAPANGASVTTTSVKLRARIAEPPNLPRGMPSGPNTGWYIGAEISFMEAL